MVSVKYLTVGGAQSDVMTVVRLRPLDRAFVPCVTLLEACVRMTAHGGALIIHLPLLTRF